MLFAHASWCISTISQVHSPRYYYIVILPIKPPFYFERNLNFLEFIQDLLRARVRNTLPFSRGAIFVEIKAGSVLASPAVLLRRTGRAKHLRYKRSEDIREQE